MGPLPLLLLCLAPATTAAVRSTQEQPEATTSATAAAAGAAPPVYPACSSDSDCYDRPLYRCVGCRYNVSRPAGICYGAPPTANATCQCMAEAPGDQCGPTNFKPNPTSQLPSYLMVGDSISMGMEKEGALFSQLLNTTAQAVHSPGNACNANRGAHCIHSWLDGCGFDIVSFNFGSE